MLKHVFSDLLQERKIQVHYCTDKKTKSDTVYIQDFLIRSFVTEPEELKAIES